MNSVVKSRPATDTINCNAVHQVGWRVVEVTRNMSMKETQFRFSDPGKAQPADISSPSQDGIMRKQGK